MKCIVNDDVQKVQHTRIFPKSKLLPISPPQGPQLLKKLVGWQEMATWWVNIVTIFQTSIWSLGHLVIWSFGHLVICSFGHLVIFIDISTQYLVIIKTKNDMWSRWQARPWDWPSKEMTTWFRYVWCLWLSLYHIFSICVYSAGECGDIQEKRSRQRPGKSLETYPEHCGEQSSLPHVYKLWFRAKEEKEEQRKLGLILFERILLS